MEITYIVAPLEDDGTPEEHFQGCLSPEEIAHLRARLEAGDRWAFCTVRVTALWGPFAGTTYLGGCSYKDRAEFMAPGGYYQDMQKEARAALRAELKNCIMRAAFAEDLLAAMPPEE